MDKSTRRSRVYRLRLEDLPPPLPARTRRTRIRWRRLPPGYRTVAHHSSRVPAFLGVVVESAAMVGGLALWRASGNNGGLAVAAVAGTSAVLLLRHL